MRSDSANDSREELTAAEYLHFHKVDRGKWIGWNRYYPVIFVFNSRAKKILEDISHKKTIKSNGEIKQFIGQLKKRRFVLEGKRDPSREQFKQMVRQYLGMPAKMAQDFYCQQQDYEHLTIVNDKCNLACPYCVREYKRPDTPGKNKSPEKINVINLCVDQFMARKIKHGRKEVNISFNGGEILVDWPIIKAVIERISTKYRDIKINYGMNTNMTLMTKEIARFCSRYDMKINISIDGYKAAHNRTRKYHNGKHSFDTIMRNLQMYNQYNPGNTINSFQGTIEYPDEFRAEQVYRMERYGFISSRLAPNLLNIEEEEAVKKAKIMGQFLKLNSRHSFKVRDSLFKTLKKRINQEQYQFGFKCKGLSCLPKCGIELNITTLRLSLLCGFIQDGALGWEELGHNIYNPALWESANRFMHRRVDSLFENCMECELVGICSGGCILSGLDSENQMNDAGCVYQKEVWKLYIQKVYQDSKNRPSQIETLM